MSLKTLRNHCINTIKITKFTRKRVFAEFVKRLEVTVKDTGQSSQAWLCCGEVFTIASEIHIHVAKHHHTVIDSTVAVKLQRLNHDDLRRNDNTKNEEKLPPSMMNGNVRENISVETIDVVESHIRHESILCEETQASQPQSGAGVYSTDALPWLPSQDECHNPEGTGKGQIMLYYRYVDILNPDEISDWQRELCGRLGLKGKIRLSTEGMNGTIGGALEATELYAKAVMAHPLFHEMTALDFKRSRGDASHFPKGLVVGVHQEIVPMGVDPKTLSYRHAGEHLSPAEFHKKIADHLKCSHNASGSGDTVIVDCRNFYESKIGCFKGAITPNIRKFNYWPEYVDKNLDLFKDKRVMMYCTGGIRCERGSAYLKSKGVCKDIFQLEGGIHNYLNNYPDDDSLYRGKLFVFDDRYAIGTNGEIISNCVYCDRPWDQYQPCSSNHCHQLVLACPDCRQDGHTACCRPCQDVGASVTGWESRRREECLCTRNRVRVPMERR